MVNTFLVASPIIEGKPNENGYRRSAALLDFKRLNKQITEAMQIVNIIEGFEILAWIFKDPIPEINSCHEWVRSIKKRYDALGYHIFRHQGEYKWIKKGNTLPKIKYDEKYEIRDDKIYHKKKVYKKFECILPGDLVVTLGFSLHPVVVMWLRRKGSLQYYVNAHIDEFVSQGGTERSLLKKYVIKRPFAEEKHPEWALDPAFHRNHKAALYCKEIARSEKAHYIEMKDFKEASDYYLDKTPTNPKSNSDFLHYIWPYSHTQQK